MVLDAVENKMNKFLAAVAIDSKESALQTRSPVAVRHASCCRA